MRIFIEDDCNKLTNHQQRTTSTINEIVLMKTAKMRVCVVERPTGRTREQTEEHGADDMHIVTGLPYKNSDKFSLDDSAL